MQPLSQQYVKSLREIGSEGLPQFGGKNASLGELIRSLTGAGVRVPEGFALTVAAFREHLKGAGLTDEISRTIGALDVHDPAVLAQTAGAIRERVRSAALPPPIARELREAYESLSREYGEDATDVAVRSSATAEDLPTASFAGQHETVLNVRGIEALDLAVRVCMASLFTERAIAYRAEQGIATAEVALSVGVQKMVRSDLGSAGVIFTLDTESGFRDVVLVTGSWGLGEVLVQGRVNPDEFWVHKPTLRAGYRPLLRKELGEKALKLVYAQAGGRSVQEVEVSTADRARFVLTDDEVLLLARWALAIEDHYSARAGRPTPMDLEWAKDGRTGDLFIVQARPETVHSLVTHPLVEIFRLRGKGRVLVKGKSVGSRIGVGPVRVLRTKDDLPSFRPGEVLVAPMTDPDWEPVLRDAAAVVTDQGGRTCHAAIVSREHGIPCVVGAGHATEALVEGSVVTVSCAEGDEGRVYEGKVEFAREEVDPATLPRPRVPLMLNLANPATAFGLAQLPSAGVGLMRIEFLVSNWIGVHPMALIHPDRVADPQDRARIRERTRGYPCPTDFFVERLASGIAQIGGAFYPRDVLVRFSDFKTSEYAGLLGGAAFEPAEANPMLGFRGASRYYDDRYREGFALECAAVRHVREEMGLTNVKVMIPFCRTLEEGRRVLAEMEKNGLRRAQGGLEVYVMCEVPSNVVLAEEFSDLFDGFSIGSNDLTQLTLGVDRDSDLLAHLFDERDPAVKRMITMVILGAHRKGRKVGICGEAPSNYPEFAEFLARCGIDSMSLNPDSLPGVARALACDRTQLVEPHPTPAALPVSR